MTEVKRNEVHVANAVTSPLKAFRDSCFRADYYPGGDAEDVIKMFRAKHPTWNLRQTLDMLILAGGKVYFPEKK